MLKNIVYFGSPEFSAEILESILNSKPVNAVGVACPPAYVVCGVVTPPDKPTGRNQILTPSPTALLAEKHNLPTYKPAKLDDANLSHLKLLKPDIFLVVSYGKIIPKSWLEIPTIGTFNIHFSLLPKYRGALCISESIKNQDKETGVTLMEMDEGLDHGPIIRQEKIAIDIDDNVLQLTTKLTQEAKKILLQTLPEICAGNYQKTPQDESQATFTKSHKTQNRENSFIPYEKINNITGKDAREIHALIRSLNPEPGAWTTITHSEAITGAASEARQSSPRHSGPDPESIQSNVLVTKDETSKPGENYRSVDIKLLKTGIKNDKLEILEVQMPGKQSISWKQFLSGHKV